MPRIRTGLDELDKMMRDRASAGEARDFITQLKGIGKSGKLKGASPEEVLGYLMGSSSAKFKMSPQDKAAKQHVERLDAVRGELGSFVGGSSKRSVGTIAESTSKNLRRSPTTGLRVPLTQGFKPMKSEGEIERQLQKEKSVFTPADIARHAMEKYFATDAVNRSQAKTTGRYVSKLRRDLSQSVINLIENAGLDTKQKSKAYELAGGSVMRRDLPVGQRPPQMRGGSRSQAEPVSPSVPRERIARVQTIRSSKFEPMEGHHTVPSVFKNAFKGFIGGAAVGTLSSKGATVAHAANMLPAGEALKMDRLTTIGNAVIAGDKRKAMQTAVLGSLQDKGYTAAQKRAIVRKYNASLGVKPKRINRLSARSK